MKGWGEEEKLGYNKVTCRASQKMCYFPEEIFYKNGGKKSPLGELPPWFIELQARQGVQPTKKNSGMRNLNYNSHKVPQWKILIKYSVFG